jgi:hypothetical protein
MSRSLQQDDAFERPPDMKFIERSSMRSRILDIGPGPSDKEQPQ